MTRPAALLVVAILHLACSDTAPWIGSVETHDGLQVISNPGEPLLADAQGLVTELWAVQGHDWEDPTLVHAGSGLVSVVDPNANRLHLVTTSGETRESMGRSGGGPGEFLRLLDAFRVGERLVVIDGGKGSVEYLDLDGDYLSSLHLEGQAWGGFPLEDGRLLVKGEFLADPTEETLGDWVRVGEGSDPTAFTSHSLDPLPEEEGVQCFDLFPWAGSAARLRSTTPQIQVFDRGGDLTREIRIDLPVEAITESERDAALSELRQSLSERGLPPPYIEQSLVVMEERWRVKCRFGPLRFDSSRRLAAFLEQNPDDLGSGNATLHLLTQEGVYLARVGFPTAWRDFTMDGGVVYALTRDPTTDVITLRAYRVELPSSVYTDATEVLAEARRRAEEDR